MAAGDSIVSICNLALIAIGEDPIASLADARKAAILCNALYDPTRRELLRMHPWKFAKKQAQLAASPTPPLFSYANAFPLPADFIRMFDEPDEEYPEYEIMGSLLMSNEDGAFDMLYIFDCQDPVTFDPLFVKTLACSLGAKLAQPMTQSATKENELAQKFDGFLSSATLIDSQETSSHELDEDIWLESRR